MAIGLTLEEMTTTFLTFLQHHLDTAKAQLDASKTGESPEVERVLSEFQQRFPAIKLDELLAIFSLIIALFDTISSNNMALSKVIPHLET